ncbi:hypothetical protein [Streptomyces sp. NBC_01197]|uniref:hypothetical protein n=1 Tax=Streptomyces sp. NBC_01197 TaxID=2903768 RepID=UPI002E0E3B61|nr:hypothetical protein OG452_20640 [Streptomyces sp. NBC_01197]
MDSLWWVAGVLGVIFLLMFALPKRAPAAGGADGGSGTDASATGSGKGRDRTIEGDSNSGDSNAGEAPREPAFSSA